MSIPHLKLPAARRAGVTSIVRASALACALAGTALHSHSADAPASRLYEDALVRFENSDVKGAIVQLKNVIRLDRRMLAAQVLMGRALLANGEVNAAEAAFDEALKQGVNAAEVVVPLAEALQAQGKPDLIISQPRFAHAALPGNVRQRLLLVKAAAASDLGQPKEAMQFLEEARALDAAAAASWIAEVAIRVRARQLAEARVAAAKAVALAPDDPRAAYQQATVAHVSGQLDAALKLYGRTLALKPTHVDALVARGGIYIDLKQFDAATADIALARRADPQDPRSAYIAAVLSERAGRAAESRQALTSVTNLLDPFPVEFLRYRPQLLMLGGMSHFALGELEKAKPYLELLLRQDANSPVSKLLAQIDLKDKRTDRAIESLEAYLRLFPGDRQAAMLLAASQMSLGRHARATQLMEAALKQGDDPAARALLGISLVNAGRFEPAAQQLEATLKADPSQLQAGVSLIGLYLAANRGQDAARVAALLVKQQPRNPGLANLQGLAFGKLNEAKQARAAFERATSLDPGFEQAQLNLARLDIDEGALDAAQTRLNALLAANPKNVDAALETARLFAARGQGDQVTRWLQRADDNSGTRLQPGLRLIDYQLAQQRPDLARETLKRLQNKAPDALPVLLTQARVQLANRETAEARATLNRTTTQVGYDPAALVQLAALQLRADNVAGAAHALDKALTESPKHLPARALRSTVYLLQQAPAKAEALARGIVASDPRLGLGYTLLADLARSRNQNAAAVDALRRAHAIDNSSDSLLRLFRALDLSQHAAAVALAEPWLKVHAKDSAVWQALGDAQAGAGKLEAARSAYQALLALTPNDAEVLNNLAFVMVMLQDPSALKTAERALALRPDVANIMGTTGWAAFHAGQTDRALQLLRNARLRDPANAGTRYFLGAVLAQQGRKGEAREELQAAVQSRVGFVDVKAAGALLKTLD